MIYTYQNSDTASGSFNVNLLEFEIHGNSLLSDKYVSYFYRGELSIEFSESIDKSQLDSLIASHDHTHEKPYPIIFDHVSPYARFKPVSEVIYKREMKTGTLLAAKHTFDLVDGFLIETEYFLDYSIDQNGNDVFTNPVLKATESYTTLNDSPINSAKSAESRVKKWYYMLSNGNYTTDNDFFAMIGYYKEKPKKYISNQQIREEGKRRRTNMRTTIEEQVGTIIFINNTSESTNEEKFQDAQDKMIALLELYESAFNVWIITGRGTIYDDIQNDSVTAWLNDSVPMQVMGVPIIPNEAFTNGWDVRTFLVERLKANI